MDTNLPMLWLYNVAVIKTGVGNLWPTYQMQSA